MKNLWNCNQRTSKFEAWPVSYRLYMRRC